MDAEVGPDGELGSDVADATDAGLTIVGDPIALSFGNCGSLSACDSDPTGVWQITGGCVAENVFSGAGAVCPDLVVTDASFTARGVFAAEGTAYAQEISSTYAATFEVSSTCRKDQGCANFTAAFALGGGHVDCADAGGDGGCTCPVSGATLDMTSAQYSRSAGVLTLGATGSSGPRTFSYCVTQDKALTEETTFAAPPVTFTWAKR